MPYTFYFGGELFSGKHLLGNAILAEAIHTRSEGRYQAVLPQNLEQRDTSAHAIRDQDIRALLACDLGLFNYDGPELDSGTVVEFMFAKFADIPAVLLRTDFRNGGDQSGVGEPWNLMTSYYPRTATVVIDAMALYQEGLSPQPTPSFKPEPSETLENNRSGEAGRAMLVRTADAVIQAFDQVLQLPSVLPGAMRETVYHWLALMPGFRAVDGGSAAELLALCATKQGKGLL